MPNHSHQSATEALKAHYTSTFAEHGPTTRGVDWGEEDENLYQRYDRMLAVINSDSTSEVSLLDVGCGFGGLLIYARSKGYQLNYTGLDVVEPMIDWAKQNINNSKFLAGDVLSEDLLEEGSYDYVVCNGILTQKLDTTALEMEAFANMLIHRMYRLCKKGIAFNVMTTAVNFHADNLYYRSPVEMLAWCMAEVSKHVRIDHAYRLYEYTTYLYR